MNRKGDQEPEIKMRIGNAIKLYLRGFGLCIYVYVNLKRVSESRRLL